MIIGINLKIIWRPDLELYIAFSFEKDVEIFRITDGGLGGAFTLARYELENGSELEPERLEIDFNNFP